MEVRKNKPRVFLSHSKPDIEFVRQIRNDLQKCQIDTWLDEDDIRHGKPWLDSIFEDGIPTCDSVIVYFSSHALQSQMVKKEIDASILSQLSDKRIAFLPYVDSASVRKGLRPDIQALQVQVWNSENYHDIIPKVVAEVWRSFMERSVHIATQEEQNRRLRLELELQKTKQGRSGNVFSDSEEADFKYIWDNIDRESEVVVEENEVMISQEDKSRKPMAIGQHILSLNLGSLVGQLISLNRTQYPSHIRSDIEKRCIVFLSNSRKSENRISFSVKKFEDPCNELLTYGLIQGVYDPPPMEANGVRGTVRSILSRFGRERFPYTEKMYRFRYWLAVNEKLSDEINITLKQVKKIGQQ
ncbi:toll/interleukin-1 receptor domain-containing protein [Desulfatitalea alkaliphila]|uniref:Toll/interleukin-1 receptor domain-containing protein n=1 Tax=Desulfatitalea alkaliphila TaxID=2929485 RepID=A0AA41R5I8_9BACT|nr:toll/interleukin-1 receptor domain-containing protein [Desulfatitalea alkaliphila]MCJ8503164.1 toll/interleukin-1 receptor domain-containing protein [Desulfatitalea alkaliphila]